MIIQDEAEQVMEEEGFALVVASGNVVSADGGQHSKLCAIGAVGDREAEIKVSDYRGEVGCKTVILV